MSFFFQRKLNESLLDSQVLTAAFFNLFVVASVGVFMRLYPFLSHVPLTYKNVLHAHSHFAFGGWVMPALVVLVWRAFPEVRARIGFKHQRAIAWLLLASAYGMLFSFPFQGYAAVSIFFSTVSVAAGFYLAIVTWKSLRALKQQPSHLFLKWGLFYLCLSAIGPFATGPLIALGYAGKPVYFNAIYFFLHFQYNGWFVFALLAVLYRFIESIKNKNHGQLAFLLMNIACPLAFCLSLLWNKPHPFYNVLGGLAALLQVVACLAILWDVFKKPAILFRHTYLCKMIALAFVLKCVLQLASAFAPVAALAYRGRNFVIAYLHLVLLGIVTFFLINAFLPRLLTQKSKIGLGLFIGGFIATECLLVAQATGAVFNFAVPYYPFLILFFSLFLSTGILIFTPAVTRQRRK